MLYAGPAESVETSSDEPWLTPSLNIRTRYEFADVNGSEVSHAFTFRERVGLKTSAWNGFSAFIEGEFSQAVGDDYFGGAPLANPAELNNSVIGDPETNELNQLILQYAYEDTTAKLGRQRIIYNNAAFVGNVGWRNNEQTYDAISLSNKSIEGLSLDLAYVKQVNRIFGSDAGGPLENLPGSIFLLNGSYKATEDLTLGAYVFHMSFDDLAAGNNLDNDTYGVSAKTSALGLDLYGEIAYQEDAGAAAMSDSWYSHATVGKKFGKQSLTLGHEFLGAGFKTPLATGHAFNGFADAFLGGRTVGTHNGLSDLYLSHSMPIFWGMKWVNTLHAMGDNEISTGYGWEYDSVLVKKFSDDLTGIIKFAHFESEGDLIAAGPAATATRFSFELNYTF